MRIGIMSGAPGGAVPPDSSIDDFVAFAKRVESLGFDSLWMAQIFGIDAIATLGFAGRETSRIELGTAVVPTYPRHPIVMAQEALTANAAAGGRFALGIGLSHKVVIEPLFGLSFDRPARHMRDYLEALNPLLRGETSRPKNDSYTFAARLSVPGVPPPTVLVAALGEVMLRLTGRLADGTITWMCGPRTLEDHIGKTIRDAAAKAGRPEPRVIAGLPVVLTDKVDEAREAIAKQLELYGTVPSYRDALDREGLAGPADVALVGDEQALREQLASIKNAGVTDLDAALIPVDDGAIDRTLEFLAAERG